MQNMLRIAIQLVHKVGVFEFLKAYYAFLSRAFLFILNQAVQCFCSCDVLQNVGILRIIESILSLD